jgi:hypothetical protein
MLALEFAEIIRRARSEVKRGEVFSLDQVEEELLEAPAPDKAKPLPLARKKRSTRSG